MKEHLEKDIKQKNRKKSRDAVKKWMEDHLILVWVISSVVFAFIVHCLFSIVAPNEWLAAKWSAGDILTFVSTVALGLLAVWQNRKFKEESDESQNRMEKLAMKTNELSIINKIIERESKRISTLIDLKSDFINACNTEGLSFDLSDIANQPDNFKKLFVKIKMDSRDKQIRLCTVELLSELKSYPDGDNTIKLIRLISNYSSCATELVKEVRAGSPNEDTYTKKTEKEKELILYFSDFIADLENMLNEVIYGNLSLEEIKALYRQNSNKAETNEHEPS